MRTRLRENETIAMMTKRHPLTVITLYALTIGFLVVWIVFRKEKAEPFLRWALAALVIISILKTWARQRDIWVVTNQRVVDEEGIFTIRSMECPLDKITNVMVAQSVPGRLLGYGKIQIQTAGEAGVTEELKVMRPRSFRNAIFEQQERYRERMMERQAKIEAEQAVEQGEMKECPFCAEWVRAKAKICRFCNRELPES
jgi:uncharacterized membrane protein YdbT with pleckstrin-like domain